MYIPLSQSLGYYDLTLLLFFMIVLLLTEGDCEGKGEEVVLLQVVPLNLFYHHYYHDSYC